MSCLTPAGFIVPFFMLLARFIPNLPMRERFYNFSTLKYNGLIDRKGFKFA